jgi:hypothetical protein
MKKFTKEQLLEKIKNLPGMDGYAYFKFILYNQLKKLNNHDYNNHLDNMLSGICNDANVSDERNKELLNMIVNDNF